MKMVMIAYNGAIDEEVLEAVKSAGLDTYTKWTKVQGKGVRSDPHLGTQVWPGWNNVLLLAAEDERVGPLLEGVRELRRSLGREGVKAFVLPVEDVT